MELVLANEMANFASTALTMFNENGAGKRDARNPISMNTAGDAVLTTDQANLCRSIWNATVNFLQDTDLMTSQQIGNGKVDGGGHGYESLDTSYQLSRIGSTAIDTLLDAAYGDKFAMTDTMKKEVYESIGLALARSKCGGNGGHIALHYTSNNFAKSNFGDMYTPGVSSDFSSLTAVPGEEAFGANMDRLQSDARMNIAVALLRFHKSALNRIAHRRPRATIQVEYEIPYAQFYSLEKSQEDDAKVRNGREHKTIILDLYRNPVPVSQKLTPIVPNKNNDKDGSLVRTGVIVPGKEVNLMTLSLDANKSKYAHTDYTDLVSDAVTMNKVYITLTDGTDTEVIALDTGATRLLGLPENLDASDRSGTFNRRLKLYAGYKTIAGTDSKLLKTLDQDDCIVVNISFHVTCRLKTADVKGFGTVALTAHGSEGTTPVKATALLAGATGVKASIEGYSINAFFSEENLRKSNIMFRTDKYKRAYEIPCGTNYMIDYAMGQQLEEFAMSMVTEGMSIGMDDRAIDLFEDNARLVLDRIKSEEHDDSYLTDNLQRINFEYVSGTRVNPWVYQDVIDLSKVESIRDSDFMSDVRQYVDTRLTRILSLNHMNTLYPQQLEPGEKVTYKVIASRIVIENLFNPPHIHNNIAQIEDKGEADGQVIEFARELTSGVVLHCISLPWDRMRDKILIMPFRPNFPDSELNYCHNWDYGTFLAHYTPQRNDGVNKRIYMNAREVPVITNPSLTTITVTNFDETINIQRGKQVQP